MTALDLALVVLVALVVRGNAVLSASFPLNDGGLFAAMVGDLVHSGFALPVTTSYNTAGIPFIYFGVEDHPDYHKPTDTADRIDPAFFGDVVEMLVDFVVTADQRIP